MAVQATDIKFYKSSNSVTSANNTNGAEIFSVGGVISADEVVADLNSLFDAVTSSEAGIGSVEYRCIYVVNENITPQTLYDAKIYIASNLDPNSVIKIALDPAPVGSDSAISLTDEIDSDSKLAALAFSTASDISTALTIGDMAGAGGKKAIWLQRVVTAGALAGSKSSVITVQGDTDL